ncbi:hypothetical protein [Cellulosimicrobium funkei]|uniref:hypothetical protein n=1 Tax=Cellulosimicrobium funkei TaxID=264251 RepID=UPI0030F9A541
MTSQVDLLAERHRFDDAGLVVLPYGRDAHGRGLYPANSLLLEKRLRSAGFKVTYADAAGRRLFEARHSAIIDAALAVGLGILTSAAWDGVKWLVRRTGKVDDRRAPNIELHVTDARPDSSVTTVTLKGTVDEVTRVIEQLQNESGGLSVLPAAAPPAFAEAGPSEDIWRAHNDGMVANRLSDARNGIDSARQAMTNDIAEAERCAREALAEYASALNWAEDTDSEESVHSEMDQAAEWVRRTFGCRLAREGTEYFQRCPIALGHSRAGLSVGGYVRKQCSLCGEDLSECSHLPDMAYLVPGGAADLGWCRVCLQRDSCEHASDQNYRVAVVAMVVEMSFEEVSLVPKPAFPDARLTSMSISASELRTALGAEFTPGIDVSCDRCLTPCGGLKRVGSPRRADSA